MSKIAVVGIGNTLRRDDGIGVVILESLLKLYRQEGVDYLNFGITSFDLLHRLRDYKKAVLIDGIHAGLTAGALKIFSLKDARFNPDNLTTSTHELNLKDIFALFKKLKLKTEIYVAGIQVKDTAFGQGLSAALENKKAEIARDINVFIDGILN